MTRIGLALLFVLGAASLAGSHLEKEVLATRGSRCVRLDPRDPHGLVREDGTPIRLLGENRINVWDRAWNWDQKDAEEYVAYMAANGMNTLRVFLFCDARGDTCLEPVLGQFDERVARVIDGIFDAAERHDVFVILVPFAIGFTPGDAWKGWEGNPASTARGGPARTPEEFFLSDAARAAAKRKLDYVLARWGSSSHLLAVDLLNEPEWDGNLGEETWRPWAEDLAAHWRARDPRGRPVTVGSVGLHWNVDGDERAWWTSPACDVVQWHLYGKEVYDVHALAREMARKVEETWGHGKPVLVGEFAWGGEPKPLYDHTHVGLWSAVMSGAGVLAHSAPPFTEDSDELMTPERARHFRVLARFLASLDPGRRYVPARPATELSGAFALSLESDGDRLVWVLGPRDGYGEPVRQASVTLSGLTPDTAHEATFFDDDTGRELGRTEVTAAADGRARLELPPFVRHVVARVR